MEGYSNIYPGKKHSESGIKLRDSNIGVKREINRVSLKKSVKMHSLERENIRKYIEHQLSEIKIELAAAQRGFDDVTDPDLLDYYTYLYKSTLAKYSYYMKQMKELYYRDKLS